MSASSSQSQSFAGASPLHQVHVKAEQLSALLADGAARATLQRRLSDMVAAAAAQSASPVSSACTGMTPEPSGGAVTSLASAWALVQQTRATDAVAMAAAAADLRLLRCDTSAVQSPSLPEHEQSLPERAGLARHASQAVFKRRTNANGTALMRHFSRAARPGGVAPGPAASQAVFKRQQRKRPLTLWASGPNHHHHPAARVHAAQLEPESSNASGSTACGSPSAAALSSGASPLLSPALASPGGIDQVLTTLACQEQQLLQLQRQLRQQRALMSERRKAKSAAARQAAAAEATADATADAQMADTTPATGATVQPQTVSALLSVGNMLASQSSGSRSQPSDARKGEEWGQAMVARLTAALLAA